VDEALKVGAGTIAIEDLKGIRSRIKVAKKQRLIQHGWPFSSLFLKIAHVASKAIRSTPLRFLPAASPRLPSCPPRRHSPG
jgi:hypothetical protein